RLPLPSRLAERRAPAPPRPRDGAVADVASIHAHEHLRGGADQRAPGRRQIEHVRARIDLAERAVQLEWMASQRRLETPRDLDLEDVAAEDVFVTTSHRVVERVARHVRE